MANLIYRNRETTLFFVPAAAAQAETKAFECHNIATGVGRQSAIHDLGEGAIAQAYDWRAFAQFAETPIVGQTIDYFLKTAGSSLASTTHPDNSLGTTEGTITDINRLKNLHYLGSIIVDVATINIEMVASGRIILPWRAFQVVMWNATADLITNDVDENGFFMSPVPPEIQ